MAIWTEPGFEDMSPDAKVTVIGRRVDVAVGNAADGRWMHGIRQLAWIRLLGDDDFQSERLIDALVRFAIREFCDIAQRQEWRLARRWS